MKFIIDHWQGIFSLLGGTGAVLGYLVAGSDAAAHWVLQKLLANPTSHDILLKYRTQIEAAFDAADKRIHADLNGVDSKETHK